MADLTKATRGHRGSPWPAGPVASIGIAESSSAIPIVCFCTNMCPGGIFNPASPFADIHPTDIGYATLAGIVAAALPYAPALTP